MGLKTIWNSASILIMSDTSIINKININIQTAIKFKKTQTSKYFIVTIYLIFLHVRYNNDIFYFLA